MKRSIDRVLVTHTGSLPRPDDLFHHGLWHHPRWAYPPALRSHMPSGRVWWAGAAWALGTLMTFVYGVSRRIDAEGLRQFGQHASRRFSRFTPSATSVQ